MEKYCNSLVNVFSLLQEDKKVSDLVEVMLKKAGDVKNIVEISINEVNSKVQNSISTGRKGI